MPSWEGITNIAYNAFVAFDPDDRIIAWNPPAEEMFGIPRAQALGRSLAETILPESRRAAHREGLRRFIETGSSPLLDARLQLNALGSHGSEFPVEMTITAFAADRSSYAFYAVLADRSELRASERERERLLAELRRALSGTEQRLAVTLDALADSVTIRGEGDRLLYANKAALQRMGLQTIDQLREADPRALLEPYALSGEDGREIHVEDLPSARVLRGEEEPEPLLMRSVNRSSGAEAWVLLKATPVRGPDGSVESAVTIIEDVSAEHRAALRTEFLAQVGQLLVSSLEYEQTLSTVVGLAVPQLADWCAIDLFDEHGGRQPVAVAHADPSKVTLAEQLRAREPKSLDPNQGLGLVLSSGRPQLYTEISDELLQRAPLDEEHLRLLRAVGVRSAMIVPMSVRERTIGALMMVNAESGRRFDVDDLAFAEQVATRAALAVENARLYRERGELAHTLQRSLLPDALPRIPRWDVAALYRPAGQQAEVGGDFYDIWEVGEDWLVLIGDVTGKGVGAATLTSLARHSARTASEFDPRPSRVLARIDAALRRRPRMSLCTALCLRIHGQTVAISSAGHPLPLHMSGGEVREVGRHGLLLGAYDGVSRPEDAIEMRPGESLVAITDGVTDALGADAERFGDERVSERLAELQQEPPVVILQGLMESIEGFQVGEQTDDTAVLVASFTGDRAVLGASAVGGERPESAPTLGSR